MRRFWDTFDDLAFWDSWGVPNFSTGKRILVNPDQYDLVPRKEYRDKLIESKQKEIQELDEDRRRLEDEIKQLKG